MSILLNPISETFETDTSKVTWKDLIFLKIRKKFHYFTDPIVYNHVVHTFMSMRVYYIKVIKFCNLFMQ